MTQNNPRLENALRLAELGCHLFPLKAKQKTPARSGWQDEATRDPDTIKAWFLSHGHNTGIYTEKFAGAGALIAVDVDVKGDKNGLDDVLRLELEGKLFPPTMTQRTPTGGQHYLYRSPVAVPQSVGKLAPGIDIRSKGGFVVGAGSITDAGIYTNDWAPIAQAPEWLIAACGATRPRSPLAGTLAHPELAEDAVQESLLPAAVDYLRSHHPFTEGSRNNSLLRVAHGLKDRGIWPWDQALALIEEHCEFVPPMDSNEMVGTVKSAYTSGQNQVGAGLARYSFDPIPVDARKDCVLHPLEAMNKEFAYCLDGAGSKAFILHETEDHEGNAKVNYLGMEAFNGLMANRIFQSGKSTVPIARAWMEWPQRRTYYGVVFAPQKAVEGRFYNLWRGFGVQAAPGEWGKLRAHIFDNICNGNQAHFDYLIKWAARMVQRPGEPGCVAIVMRSSEGAGKGKFAHTLRKIAGQHGMYLSHSKHLVGAFNSHLEGKIFIFADECFYAGDKAQEGALKAIISEDKLLVEPKGRTPYQADNCLHLVLATNNDWAIPASASARRFLVLDVNESRMQDTAYFQAVQDELDAGGYEAFLDALLKVDLAGFNVFDVPKTKALGDQKDRTLRGPAAWLRHTLNCGSLREKSWTAAGTLVISKADAHAAYVEWVRGGKHRGDENVSQVTFGRDISKVLGDALTDTRLPTGRRENAYRFAPLLECRVAFDRHMRQPMEWDAPEEHEQVFAAPAWS